MKMSGGVPPSTTIDDTETTGVPHAFEQITWDLQAAEEVNEADRIVGTWNWTDHGSFAWVLVPQAKATQ
jgi:hypothetical protein